MMQYTTPVELRVAMHGRPAVAKARKEMADSYRTIRRDNPGMARLLRRRIKAASDELAWSLFSTNASSLLP